MNDKQQAFIGMCRTTVSVCHDYESTWTADANFSNTLDEIEDNIDALDAQVIIQENDNTGVAEQKQVLRDELIEKTRFVAVRIESYGTVTDNNPLVKSVKMSPSRYELMSGETLFHFASKIHELASDNATALASFGITSTIITELSGKITAYLDYLEEPEKVRDQRTESTLKIVEIIKTLRRILSKRLDVFAKIYETTAPEFYSRYTLARQITEHSTQTMALHATLTDQATSQPIANVNVNIPDAGISRTSSENGVFEVQNLSEGTHDIILDHPDYMPLTYPATIVSGQTTNLTIPMVHK